MTEAGGGRSSNSLRRQGEVNLIAAAGNDFPYVIARPSIVIGHSEFGVALSKSIFWAVGLCLTRIGVYWPATFRLDGERDRRREEDTQSQMENERERERERSGERYRKETETGRERAIVCVLEKVSRCC